MQSVPRHLVISNTLNSVTIFEIKVGITNASVTKCMVAFIVNTVSI